MASFFKRILSNFLLSELYIHILWKQINTCETIQINRNFYDQFDVKQKL